jgi:hypothetical protein
MPAGLIDEQRGVRARRDLGGDFGQMQVHGFGVAPGQDEGCTLAVLGADCAEYISGGGSLISGSARTRSALGPTAGDLVLLADARLVGEPDLYGVGSDALLAADLSQALGKTYGMARPSFRRRRVAGGSEGGVGYGFDGNLCSWR